MSKIMTHKMRVIMVEQITKGYFGVSMPRSACGGVEAKKPRSHHLIPIDKCNGDTRYDVITLWSPVLLKNHDIDAIVYFVMC